MLETDYPKKEKQDNFTCIGRHLTQLDRFSPSDVSQDNTRTIKKIFPQIRMNFREFLVVEFNASP